MWKAARVELEGGGSGTQHPSQSRRQAAGPGGTHAPAVLGGPQARACICSQISWILGAVPGRGSWWGAGGGEEVRREDGQRSRGRRRPCLLRSSRGHRATCTDLSVPPEALVGGCELQAPLGRVFRPQVGLPFGPTSWVVASWALVPHNL